MATIAATAKQKAWTGAGSLGGVSNRTSSPDADISSKITTTHPALKLCSYYHTWDILEPNKPVDINTSSGFVWTNFEKSIATARVAGVKLILRIECGYRTPRWIYSSSTAAGQPATRLYLVDINGHNTPGMTASGNNYSVPLPWTSAADGTTNANLVAHYTRLLKGIQAEMVKSDGAGGLIGDHVYFVAVAMTTTIGTEMSLGYQAATGWSGTYDGPSSNVSSSPTYKSINTAEWNNYGTEANRQTYYINAWRKAADLHMQYLPAVPSSVAYGTDFGSASQPEQMATDYAVKYKSRLCHMITDLKVDSVPNGTYAGADTLGDTVLKNAIAGGGWVGCQSAAHTLVPNAANMQASTADGLATYNMTFYESAEPNLTSFYAADATSSPAWIGIAALQTAILGQAGKGGRFKLAGSKAAATVQVGTLYPYVYDDFNRVTAAGFGSVSGTQSSGGAYTLTGTAADFNTDGANATIALTAASQTKTAQLAGVSLTDTYQTALFSLGALPTGSWCAFDHRMRYVDANNLYRIRVFFNTDGTITLRFVATVGGVSTTLGGGDAATGITFTAGRNYRLLGAALDTNPTTLLAKFWDTTVGNKGEPANWLVQTTDSSAALQVAASTAIACASNAGVTGTPYTFTIAEWYAASNHPTTNGTPGIANLSSSTVNASTRGSKITVTKRRWTPRS